MKRFLIGKFAPGTLTILLAIGLLPVSVAGGQIAGDAGPVEGTDSSGEVTSAIFDDLTVRAHQNDATIFVLSRVGAREHSRFNYRRLHNALYRLTEYYGSSRPKVRVIGAIGERTDSAGVVEIYLGGRLHIAFGTKTLCADRLPDAARSRVGRRTATWRAQLDRRDPRGRGSSVLVRREASERSVVLSRFSRWSGGCTRGWRCLGAGRPVGDVSADRLVDLVRRE